MTVPTVSVIIPAYRAAHTIARPLGSILAQTVTPDEIIVIDDGSPDNLAAALEPFKSHVKLLLKPNGGAASARNYGLDHAEGDLIAFLDADDYWEPEKLQRQLRVLRDYPEVGIVGSRWFEQDPTQPRKISKSLYSPEFFGRVVTAVGADAFRVATSMWTSTLLVRKPLLKGERFVSGLEPAEDRDLWVRLAARASVYLIPDPLATYVLEPNSLSRSNVDRDCGNMLRVIHRHSDLLGKRERRAQEAITFRRWAAGHLGLRDPAAAIRPAFCRIRRTSLSAEAWWILLKAIGGALVFRFAHRGCRAKHRLSSIGEVQ